MFYQQRPYIYAFLGFFSLILAKGSRIAIISGIVLLLCAAYVYYMRSAHQDLKNKSDKKHSQLTQDINDKNKNNRI